MLSYLTVLILFSSAPFGHFYIYRSFPRTSHFCSIKCGLKKHICCIYGYEFGEHCVSRPVLQPIGDLEKEIIVDILNTVRSEVASGKAAREDLRGITASNMNTISYSKKLAYTASCWAKQCIPNHSRCRAVEEGRVGETVCWSHGFNRKLANFSAELLLRCPRSLLPYFPQFQLSIIDNLELPLLGDDERNRETIQLLWAKTRLVGCSRIAYPHEERGFSTVLMVCHYFPGGNIINTPMFLRGKPCSECGNDLCSQTYPNLCGEVRPLKEDDWIPPMYKSNSVKNEFNAALIMLLINRISD